jgi:Kef-type K+ transport system membrane component KefB
MHGQPEANQDGEDGHMPVMQQGLPWHQSLMIGFGMLGRAELAFVVIDIGYVQNAILPTEAFFALMITAFFLNTAVPLTISWWRPYYEATEARTAGNAESA